MAVSLTPPPQEGTINLAPKLQVVLDDRVVQSRTQKADYALGPASPGETEIAQSIYSGFEKNIREIAALAEQNDRREQYIQSAKDIADAASAEGRALTDAELSYVLDKPEGEIASERTAMEQRYANRVVSEVTPSEEDGLEYEVVDEEARSIVTKQQIAQRLVEDIQSKHDSMSWASWGVDFAKGMIPFYDWYQMADRIEGVQTSSVLTGQNIQEQLRGLYLLPANEFDAKLTEAVNELAESNMVSALMFAQAAVAYSNSDQVMDNLFFGMDAVDVATLGTSAVLTKGARLGKAARAAKLKGVIKETANPVMTPVDRLVVQGEGKAAVEAGVTQKLNDLDLLDSEAISRPQQVVEAVAKKTFALNDSENFVRSASSLTEEAQRRLLQSLEENDKLLRSSHSDVTHVVRLNEEQAAIGFKKAEEDFRRWNFRLTDGIVDVAPVRESVDAYGGVDYIKVFMGDKNALPFKSYKAAETYAEKTYRLAKGNFDVEAKGGSFFVTMKQNVREDTLDIYEMAIKTDAKAPENLKNQFIGWLRNPDDIRSVADTETSKVATYGGNAVQARMIEVAKSIGKLGKNESQRLSAVMEDASNLHRIVIDPKTQQPVRVAGKFYGTVAELEQAYAKKGYSLPSPKEIEAYFSFRQVMDYQLQVQNISMWRDKSRLGIVNKSVSMVHYGAEGRKNFKGTDYFEGRDVDALPDRSGAPFTVLWDNGAGDVRFGLSSRMYPRDWKEIDELLEKGYRITQVADDSPFKAMTNAKGDSLVKGEDVQFVITREVKEKPLSLLQIEPNEGGHWIYPTNGNYIKQAKTRKTGLGRRIYDSDVTVHYVPLDEDAAGYARAYEDGRKMIINNDPGLAAHLASTLPYDEATFRSLFKDGTFDLDSPFVVTQNQQSVSDVLDLREVFKDREFVDASPYSLLGQVNTRYAQKRGERLTSIKKEGTPQNPVFKKVPAEKMDPFSALARSSSQIARSRMFDDWKHRNISNWLTQFRDVFDVSQAELRADPMGALREPRVKGNYADKAKVSAMWNTRRALLYQLGTDAIDAAAIKWTKQKIVNGVMKAHGKDGMLIDAWKWDRNADPAAVARSAVFHAKLGLFNPTQLPLQALSVLWTMAVDGSPIRAAQAQMMYWASRVRGLAQNGGKAQGYISKKVAKALGIDEFTMEEAYNAYKNSGWSIIEGEYARLDDYLNPSAFYSTGLDKAKAASTAFFKEGNMIHKGQAFYTAYLRWRAENPKATLNAAEMQKIEARADLYYNNMSRASNNPIRASSLPSVPLQFITYHGNVSEALLGARLNWKEKARVMGLYSAMFGVPVGLGMPLSVFWPISEEANQVAMEQGFDMQDPYVQFFMKGGGQVLLSAITGENWNFSDRYSTAGLTWIRDLFENGDLYETFSGASGSTLASSYQSMAPIVWGIVDAINPNRESQITEADWINAAREISTLNNAYKAYYLLTARQFASRNGRTQMHKYDADLFDATLVGILGLQPQEIGDSYLQLRSMKEEDAAKKAISDQAALQIKRALKAASDGDSEASTGYHKRAIGIMNGAGLSPKEQNDLFNRVYRDNEGLVEKASRQFINRDPLNRTKGLN